MTEPGFTQHSRQVASDFVGCWRLSRFLARPSEPPSLEVVQCARRGTTLYRCTGFRGRCGNSYIREEVLADLLGNVVKRIQISPELAESIAEGLRDSQGDLERERQATLARLSERRQRVQAKLDRGYDDYLEGLISQDFWTRKSAEWEGELGTTASELSRLSSATPSLVATGEGICRTRENRAFSVAAAYASASPALPSSDFCSNPPDSWRHCGDDGTLRRRKQYWRCGREDFRLWLVAHAA
jgi:hypothetical protein